MEFENIVVKESPGLCRCCLSEGCYKDLSTEYPWMEDTEVYADMLLECFDISISQHMEGPNGPNRLICEVCITRLRDACNFKKQVLDSEKKFVDMIGRGEFRPKAPTTIYEDHMKSEVTLEPLQMEGEEVEFLEDDFDNDSYKEETSTTIEEVIATPLRVKGKRGRPKKGVVKAEKKSKVAKIDEKPRTSKAVSKDEIAEMKYELVASEIRKENLRILFNNSTIVPFEWIGKYLCFYCNGTHDDYNKFREHASIHIPCNANERGFKVISGSDDEIKVDISMISCSACFEDTNSLEELIDHLIDVHEMNYDQTVDILFEEYKLAEMRCQFCDEQFEEFEYLHDHVVQFHPQNCFRCDDCNLSFSSHRDLYFHIKYNHRQEGYLCDQCPEIFDSQNVLEQHKSDTHFKKCKTCPLKFPTEELLAEHLDAEHPSRKIELVPKVPNGGYKKRQNLVTVLNMTTVVPFTFFTKFTCFYCSIKFTEFDDLKVHTELEHPSCDMKMKAIKRFKEEAKVTARVEVSHLACKLCRTQTTDLDELIDHLIDNHKAKYYKSETGCFEQFRITKDKIPCLQCSKVFRYFVNLLKHLNAEHSTCKYVCSYCGRVFRKSGNLAAHVSKTHLEQCECKDCGLTFRNISCLDRHNAKIHGLKQYKCTKCSEMFESYYHKYRHMIQEHNIGHKCSYCGRMFTRNSFMKDHVRRVHLKQKDVPCTLCNKKFYENYSLNLHMVKVHGDRRFTCHVCGQYFMRQSNLNKHVEDHKESGDLVQFEEIEVLEGTEGVEEYTVEIF